MQVIGFIKFKGETEDVGTSGFQKRDLVVTTEEQYPQHILLQFNQAKCNLLDQFAIGQKVVVDINLRGREWVNPQGETKYFNTIEGWRIALDANSQPQPQATAPATAQPIQPVHPSQRKLVMVQAGAVYADWVKAGWTDAMLVQHGHAKYETTPATPTAPAPAQGNGIF